MRHPLVSGLGTLLTGHMGSRPQAGRQAGGFVHRRSIREHRQQPKGTEASSSAPSCASKWSTERRLKALHCGRRRTVAGGALRQEAAVLESSCTQRRAAASNHVGLVERQIPVPPGLLGYVWATDMTGWARLPNTHG